MPASDVVGWQAARWDSPCMPVKRWVRLNAFDASVDAVDGGVQRHDVEDDAELLHQHADEAHLEEVGAEEEQEE